METRGSKSGDSKAITIYDIAREAGVSASTVSRVLTDKVRVSSVKRDRVMKIVEKYNFKPNAFARGLVETRSRNLGILLADVRNPFYAAMFVACEIAARTKGYSVSLYNFLGDMKLEEELLEQLVAQRADAAILLGGHVDELVSDMAYADAVNAVMENIPVITTGRLDGTRCNTVRIDSMRSMELVMEHLSALGHERVAFVGGRMDVLATYEKAVRCRQLCKAAGIEYGESMAAGKGGYDFDSGYEQMNRLLEKGERPTAVIAVNDFAAFGIMRSIREHGLEIPGDISLVSFDNTYMAESASPKLTSVDYNYTEYGKTLVDTAIRLIEGKEVERIQMVEPLLVVRESSGAWRKREGE